ncbi:hypothetical protein Clacol_009076 [Clathrus columnatus]|uniref:Uncharacterized protein n=1 Tax=Clathrus columnatus TaxID=1419009 RepID=A0AAV5AMR8_9AGAM|nr:hypothetical protein Clacol_009076 [Clathrus columnatus]
MEENNSPRPDFVAMGNAMLTLADNVNLLQNVPPFNCNQLYQHLDGIAAQLSNIQNIVENTQKSISEARAETRDGAKLRVVEVETVVDCN